MTDKKRWSELRVSQDQTHHTLDGNPAYSQRYPQVLKFHYPGLAPVRDSSGAYHIDCSGEPRYDTRFSRTFGFYAERAAVDSSGQWFHILEDGRPLYQKRYSWCGNYQEGCAVVRDSEGRFFHLDLAGRPLYSERYRYVGDFHDHSAVVQLEGGHYTHIDTEGKQLHGRLFNDLDVYHKGFARAKNSEGWFHIDSTGRPLYRAHYSMVEPFYNGVARVEDEWGKMIRIREDGTVVEELRERQRDPFHDVSADLVSFWKFFTLRAAHSFEFFDRLPASTHQLSEETSIEPHLVEAAMRALQEISYVVAEEGEWKLSERGEFLSSSHPHSLAPALSLWMGEHFDCWSELEKVLLCGGDVFKKKHGKNWFEYLTEKGPKRKLYHQALKSYASRDYDQLSKRVDFSLHREVADVGGGSGALLRALLEKVTGLKGHLIDLPEVIQEVGNDASIQDRMTLHSADFFGEWPRLKVDAVILSRVIHDWPDKEAIHILERASSLVRRSPESRVYLIENDFDKNRAKGALLNLNMMIMTGSQERSNEEYRALATEAGLEYDSKLHLNEVTSIMVFKPR